MTASRRPFAVAAVYLGTVKPSLAISIVTVALSAIRGEFFDGGDVPAIKSGCAPTATDRATARAG